MRPAVSRAITGTALAVLVVLPSLVRASSLSLNTGQTERPTAAVVDFEGYGTPPEDVTIVAQFVRSAVVKSGIFTVVDKHNMDKILREQAFQRAGCTGTECAVRLGRILNVRYIVIGTYSMFEGGRILSVQVVDVENGSIVASESESLAAYADIKTASETLVSNMLRPVRVPPAPTAEVAPVVRPRPPMEERAPVMAPLYLPREESPWKWLTCGGVLAAAFVAAIAFAH